LCIYVVDINNTSGTVINTIFQSQYSCIDFDYCGSAIVTVNILQEYTEFEYKLWLSLLGVVVASDLNNFCSIAT
jgi:hypothetical protein